MNKFHIGTVIKARRMQLHLSITELGRRSGLSTPFLSQVEKGSTNLSLASLVKVAAALEVSLSYFTAQEEADKPIPLAANPNSFTLGQSPLRYTRLGSDKEDRRLEPLLIVVPPRYKSAAPQHLGEQFVCLLDGQLEIHQSKGVIRLEPHHTLHFHAPAQHHWHNPGEEEARLLWVGTPRWSG